MATLTDFRLRISAKLGLDNTVAGDQGLIDSWVNEAVTEILVRTHAHVTTTTIALVAGTADYTLATTILAINDLYLTSVADSSTTRMYRRTPSQIIDFRIGAVSSSPPVLYYALNGTDLLMVYPTPAAADTITVYYTPRPATLAAGSDTPSDIPVEWHKIIEYYGLWQGGQYKNDEPSKNGDAFRTLYEDELRLMKRNLTRRGGRKLSPAVVGRRFGSRFPIGSPSQQNV